jgi:threonine/homoserine/homoserine lactone efflux protein
MPDASSLIAFIAVSAVLGVTPGPDIIYVIMRGASQGGRAGIAAAAGLSTGVVGHVSTRSDM